MVPAARDKGHADQRAEAAGRYAARYRLGNT
jgi:hypothetical protein